MYQKLLIRLAKEKLHFDNLGVVVKHLLFSYALFLISSPMLDLFINAFFWRQTHDITLIAAYNLGCFIALPVGFYLNGLLLRQLPILKLYWIGTVLQGVAAFLAIFIPSHSFDRILLYGAVYGIGAGLYWGNKNYITLKITKGRDRHYYNNLESSISLVIGIIVPALIGWVIVSGETIGAYSADTAYKILMVAALILLTISGYVLQSADIYSEKIRHITISKPTRYWNMNRFVLSIYWIMNGVNAFIPSILVLMFVGKEGVLGTIESITAAIVAILLYFVGRKAKQRHAIWTVAISSIIFLTGAICFNLTYGFVGALIYTATCSLTSWLSGNAIYTITMEVMDKEKEHNHNLHQYALVFDNELFFNIGRILGMILLFGLAKYTTQEFSLRLTPIIVGILQFAIILPLGYLMKYVEITKV